MNKKTKKYERPVIAKVKFEDKSLVSFAVCKKQTSNEQISASCCQYGQQQPEYNLTNFDPS